MNKVIAQIIIVAASVIIWLTGEFFNFSFSNDLKTIGISIFCASAFLLSNEYLLNENYIRKYFFSRKYFKAKEIRLSLSYLYRIKIDDKYLLIKGDRINQYQPVGGVYKRLNSSAAFFDKYGVKDDNNIALKDSDKDDLRIRVPRKYLFKILKWFDEEKDREVNHWREFSEELIQSKILTHENFPHVFYRVKDTIKTKLKYSPHFKCYEILHYDILELLPTPEQRNELTQLQVITNDDRIVWAEEEEIERLGYDKNKGTKSIKIGEHCKHII